MNSINAKLSGLPHSPGVYFFKDQSGKVIYIGKAAVLKHRVRSYFQINSLRDTKTELLVAEIVDVEWREVGSEIEALFLESEMIKRYLPKYNIDLRDDKHYQYVRIDFKAVHPTVQIVRRPLDDGAEYFGPYISGVREALKYLRRIFPFDYSVPNNVKKRASLHYHIGLSPGLEASKTSLEDYRAGLRKLALYLKGKRKALQNQLEKEMKQASRLQTYERAAILRNQLAGLNRLDKQIIFSDSEQFDISKDQGLNGLAELLGLKGAPHRIEGYDISHMSGTNNVASLVVFTNGVSDKAQYRKFKMQKPGNDDFAHMREVITRRFSGRNLENWLKPDLILIDGGKGQVNAALAALNEKQMTIPLIGLAKRLEQIIVPRAGNKLNARSGEQNATDNIRHTTYGIIQLPRDSHIVKLLQRIRDESHRFAVSYHSTLKIKAQTASKLEDIPGIGPATRKKLIRHFGSIKGLKVADLEEISHVVGSQKAEQIKKGL
jgi:excinuclease ABC subunit C